VLPSTFQALADLRHLRLSKNGLHSIPPQTFIRNSRLEFLDLSFNLINSIPDNLFSMNSSLVSLDLSHNVLTNVRRFLLNVSSLRHLVISSNFLSQLRLPVFRNLVNIVYFDVRENRLEDQLDGRLLSWLPRLEEFLIDRNNVTGVRLQGPSVRLVRLTMLSNALTELPRLFQAPKLERLDVNNNYTSAR